MHTFYRTKNTKKLKPKKTNTKKPSKTQSQVNKPHTTHKKKMTTYSIFKIYKKKIEMGVVSL